MRIVDDAILELLEAAVPPIDGESRVHYGFVPLPDDFVNGDTKVITAVLPYLAYTSSVGDDSNRRLVGLNGRRSVFIRIEYVGESVEQAKWAGEQQRAALADRTLQIDGRRAWRILLGESQQVRRDDDAARPDGSPLFYGVDLYSVAITRTAHE